MTRPATVSHLRWHHQRERFLELSRHLYPRQEKVPYTLEDVEQGDAGIQETQVSSASKETE
jgi:hypothetical protein